MFVESGKNIELVTTSIAFELLMLMWTFPAQVERARACARACLNASSAACETYITIIITSTIIIIIISSSSTTTTIIIILLSLLSLVVVVVVVVVHDCGTARARDSRARGCAAALACIAGNQ